ncbi:hypothetical protein Ancab_015356 [Ancistrocladus abbreviatus]
MHWCELQRKVANTCPQTGAILALPTMEAFALLKYWKGGRGDCNTVSGRNCGGVVAGGLSSTAQSSSSSTRATIVTTISNPDAELDDDDDDDKQFFDLEFSIPNEEVEEAEVEGETSENVGKEIGDVVEDVVAEGDKKTTLSLVLLQAAAEERERNSSLLSLPAPVAATGRRI